MSEKILKWNSLIAALSPWWIKNPTVDFNRPLPAVTDFKRKIDGAEKKAASNVGQSWRGGLLFYLLIVAQISAHCVLGCPRWAEPLKDPLRLKPQVSVWEAESVQVSTVA